VGANAVPPVGSALSTALGRQRGSGPGPCRRLCEPGVWGRVGVLAPPWAGSPVREALPARGQQRVREQEALGLVGPAPGLSGCGATLMQGLCREGRAG